jgi:lipopolysaccharide export system protein LptA
MKMKLPFVLALVLVAGPALAQQPPQTPAPAAASAQRQPAKKSQPKKQQDGATDNLGLGGHNSNAPINVSSDNFEGDLATKVGTYIGNVIVVQADMRMRADRVKVNVAQGKPTRIEATGKVVVNAPNGTATGDNGVYELGPRTVTMTGHVVLTKEKDVMRGTKLVMDMNTHVAHLTAQGMPGSRVQSLFVPNQQPQNGNQKNRKGQKQGRESDKPARVQQTIEPAAAGQQASESGK